MKKDIEEIRELFDETAMLEAVNNPFADIKEIKQNLARLILICTILVWCILGIILAMFLIVITDNLSFFENREVLSNFLIISLPSLLVISKGIGARNVLNEILKEN